MKYAKPLEYGTRKMAARPFMKPAFEKNKDKIQDKISGVIDKALRRYF